MRNFTRPIQVDNRDLDTLEFSLFLDEPNGVGTARDPSTPPAIGLYERQGLSCFTKTTNASTRPSGYVELEFMRNRVTVNADASVFELRCGSQSCRESLGTLRGGIAAKINLRLNLTFKGTRQRPNDFLLSACSYQQGADAV